MAPKSERDSFVTTKATILKTLDVFSSPIVVEVLEKHPTFREARDKFKGLDQACTEDREMCERNIHVLDNFITREKNLGHHETNLTCYLKQCREEQQVFCDSIQL